MADIDVYNILESLEDFGLKYSEAPSLHNKMKQLSQDFSLDEEELGNTIVAFALNAKKKILDVELLNILETELSKGKNRALKEKDNVLKTPSIKTKTEEQYVPQMEDENFVESKNLVPLFGSYACFAPVRGATSELSYIHRKNKGNVVVSYEGAQYTIGKKSSGQATVRIISSACDGYIGNDKAAAIIEAKSERLSDFASLYLSSNPEVTMWTTKFSPSTETYFVCGEVIREKNDIFHDGQIYLQLNDDDGTVLPVDIKNLKNITIFPGQIVAFSGLNPTGKIFEAKEQLALSPAPTSPLGNSTIDHLKMWIAAGPFTSSATFSYEPLYDLLQLVKQEEPHVLVLMGPFVDRKAKLFSDPSFSEDPEDILNNLLANIGKELENCKTEVILQPSPIHDTANLGSFPAPPIIPGASLLRNVKNKLHFVADPAVVSIEGVAVALSGSEIITHLSKAEYHVADESVPRIDRISRLFNHILEQRSMYPLSPSGIPSSLLDTMRYAEISTAPNILILPSVLPPSIKVANDTVICNPGCVLKGKNGTFLKVDVNLEADKKSPKHIVNSSLIKIVRL